MRTSENRYQAIFESAGTATIIIEEDMTISRANSEFEKISGYSKKKIEGNKKFTEFFEHDSLERMKRNRMQRISQHAVPGNYECTLIDRQGNIKPPRGKPRASEYSSPLTGED